MARRACVLLLLAQQAHALRLTRPPALKPRAKRAAKAATLAMLIAALAGALHLNASVTQPPLPAAVAPRPADAYDLELADALAAASARSLASADGVFSYSYALSYYFVAMSAAPSALPSCSSHALGMLHLVLVSLLCSSRATRRWR